MSSEKENLKKYYEFELRDGYPVFSVQNILLLEALIKYNSDYSVTADENHPEFGESYAGILTKERESFFDFVSRDSLRILETEAEKINKNPDTDEEGREKDSLYKVVQSIDKINSTHLMSEGSSVKVHKGILKTVERIKSIDNLKERMKAGDPSLVHEIASAVETKYNFSFASKFCVYVSEIALEKSDAFCIYDNVVQSVLPLYIHRYVGKDEAEKYYKIVNKGKKNARVESTVSNLKCEKGYKEYRDIINRIIKGVEDKDDIKITYSQFDHMLWYYFKGSKLKVQEALNTLLKDS
ncbi:MAG: hypothetical protein E7532_02070 [Ruminococcaceae bacterium]|nr:hypothetical protein [Oscillospiraceae bacterium]